MPVTTTRLIKKALSGQSGHGRNEEPLDVRSCRQHPPMDTLRSRARRRGGVTRLKQTNPHVGCGVDHFTICFQLPIGDGQFQAA